MRNHQVIYFSRDIRHIDAFYQKASKPEYASAVQLNTSIFEIIDEKRRLQNCTIPQLNVEDLLVLLRKLEKVDDLFIIIDYISFYAILDNSTGKYVAYKEQQSLERKHDYLIVRKVILAYPEIVFLFDQSELKHHNELYDFMCYISDNPIEEPNPLHVFDWDTPFVQIVQDYSNLFDGSKLRLAIKDLERKRLGMSERQNFAKIQKSREELLALSIEEEHRQNRFNCYALYACGYRVIPVHTARMLLMLNDCCGKNKAIDTPSIVIRDGDLQLPDTEQGIDYKIEKKEDSSNSWEMVYFKIPKLDDNGFTLVDKTITICDSAIDSYVTDCIRDWKYDSVKGEWSDRFPMSNNPFWSSFINDSSSVFFVTNGHKELLLGRKYFYFSERCLSKKRKVSGIQKPVSGLYYPFFQYFKDKKGNRIVKNAFDNTRYHEGEGGYYIIKTRDNAGGHGVPPDVYDMVEEMIERADQYYQNEHYIRAAVVAQEAIEILNGFHPQMMLRAYHIKTIAEHAIAMDVVGVNEDNLVYDSKIRIGIIKEDILRIVSSMGRDESCNQQKHIEKQMLLHIWSDCRDRCRTYEYFEAESVFISAMAQLEYCDPQPFSWIIKKIRYANEKDV